MPNNKPIISISGLRGIVGTSLTPDVVTRYCAAFCEVIDDGPIVITRDGRATGSMVAELVRGAVCAAGRDVIDADVSATPTTGVLVRQLNAGGGIQISASHNPLAYNGLKLFGADGRVVPSQVGNKVLTRYDSAATLRWASHEALGKVSEVSEKLAEHTRLVLAQVDVAKIQQRQFRVVLDSNHGAGSILGQHLLSELGCQTTLLGGEPNGQFAHPPEPTRENLKEVAATVQSADVGFCQDPDADRLALIDENGRYVGEEFTLAICLNHVLNERKGPVVTNCATSRMSEDIANKYGVPFYRSAVGEANVADEMLRVDAAFGGEGNGGPIDPRVGFVRDSFVGMAMVLDAMAASDKKLSTLADELPQYAIHKTTVAVAPDAIAAALDAVANHFSAARADRLDGLRLDWDNKWLLVRASNTEPIVRAIAEAPTAEEAEALCEKVREVLA